MNILVASDSFKGTLTSLEVGSIIKECLKENHFVDVLSISDGGEGMIEALYPSIDGNFIELDILDPLRRPIKGTYYISKDKKTAIIESAIACGLTHLTVEERNPLKTSSYGLGQLIKHAIEEGAKKLIIGIGGSSTNDAGIGLLEALGVGFYDITGQKLSNLKGEDLIKIRSIHTEILCPLLKGISIEVACDVDNVLLGETGASYIFGPQKGATKSMCDSLEAGMASFADIVESSIARETRYTKGAGAAGGIGMCLQSFLNAELKRGIDLILESIDFDEKIALMDIVITGEGRIDHQTAFGKVVEGISKRSRQQGKTVYAVCAINDSGEGVSKLFDKVFSIVPNIATLEEAVRFPREYLKQLIVKEMKKKLLDQSVE